MTRRRLWLVLAALGAAGAVPALPAAHLIFPHFAKTGGTSMRTVVFAAARELNATVQTHYGEAADAQLATAGGHPFDASAPADIIFGHFAYASMVVDMRPHMYATMFREPMAWALSLYLHFRHDGMYANMSPSGFIAESARECPAMSRLFASNTTDDDPCDSHLFYWLATREPVEDSSCAALSASWSRPSVLVLLYESYDDSVRLLRGLLGLPRSKRIEADTQALATSREGWQGAPRSKDAWEGLWLLASGRRGQRQRTAKAGRLDRLERPVVHFLCRSIRGCGLTVTWMWRSPRWAFDRCCDL